MASPAPGGGLVGPPPGVNPVLATLIATQQHVTVAPAAVVSALFLAAGLLAARNLRWTLFRVYLLLTFSCFLRGIGFALRAASVNHFDIATVAASYACSAAGMGMGVAVHAFIVACWFKNAGDYARPSPRISLVVNKLGIALVPAIIVFGPILGVVGAVLTFGVGTMDVLESATRIRQTTQLGLLCVMALVTLLTAWASVSALLGARRARKAEPGRPPWMKDRNLLVVVYLPGCLFMLLSLANRVAAVFGHPQMQGDENILYPMAVLPELLDVCVLVVPTLMARACLANNYDQHIATVMGHKPQSREPAMPAAANGQVNGAKGTLPPV